MKYTSIEICAGAGGQCLFLNTVDSFQPLFFNICLSIRKKLTRSTGKS